ncbi:hypothetical protein GCM10010505_54350 [Kitasatospora aburaviensis]
MPMVRGWGDSGCTSKYFAIGRPYGIPVPGRRSRGLPRPVGSGPGAAGGGGTGTARRRGACANPGLTRTSNYMVDDRSAVSGKPV